MKNILGIMAGLLLVNTAVNAQGYDANIYSGNKNVIQHDDPLHGLSSNPWEQYSNTGASGTQRVVTPWNNTTYYPTPPTDKYIGNKTTWDDAKGQAETAPEVNIYNMLVMTDHLRSLGYQIPEGFDEGLRKAPAHLHDKILNSLSIMSVDRGDPFSKSSSMFIEIFNEQTGFDMENLISTSIGILDNK